MVDCQICKGNSPELVMQKNGFELVKCNYDGHLYVMNPPSLDKVREIYTKEYFEGHSPIGYHHNVFTSTAKQTAKAARKLERIISFGREGRLLDVGSGPGFFLDRANLYFEAEGIDISAAASDYARLEFRAKMHHGSFEDFKSADQSYSVITMWSVLEHMIDPRANLSHAAQLLKKDGLLALSFPNAFGITRYVKRRDWRGFQFPEHLHFFSNRNLARLLKETGFEPLGINLKDNNFFRDTCYMMARRI